MAGFVPVVDCHTSVDGDVAGGNAFGPSITDIRAIRRVSETLVPNRLGPNETLRCYHCIGSFEIIRGEEENLVKVSVLYPNAAGCRFDMNYYLGQHMPMVQQKLGPACKRMAVEEGIAGGAPAAPATYVAMGHLYFDSIDAFQSAFAPHAQEIMADIPNYTDTQPIIQISEVKM